MPRNSDEDLQKHTLFLFAGDYEELRDLNPEAGAAFIIRRIVRAYLTKVKAGGPAHVEVDVNI